MPGAMKIRLRLREITIMLRSPCAMRCFCMHVRGIPDGRAYTETEGHEKNLAEEMLT